MTIEKARRILQEIKNTAHEASLIGSMSNGAGALVKAYNVVYKHAISQQWVEDIGIVSELNVDEKMGYVGCSAALLMSMLEEK